MPQRLTRAVRLMAAAKTPEDVVERLATIVAPNVKVLSIWPMRVFSDPLQATRETYFHRDISEEFRRRLQFGWDKYGVSVMGAAAALSPLPFTFSEAMRTLQPHGNDRWLIDLLAEYGIRDGLYCGYGSWLVAYGSHSVLRNQAALSDEIRATLYAAGATAVYRLMEMRPEKYAGVTLSPQEQAVLRHLSQGHGVAEIAMQLDLSENSVRTYVRRAQNKLEAKNQLHAVALAVRRRLI